MNFDIDYDTLDMLFSFDDYDMLLENGQKVFFSVCSEVSFCTYFCDSFGLEISCLISELAK